MIKTILHKIISIWIVALLLFPIGVQFFHTIENHEHFVCKSNEVSHVHSQAIDCEFCHVLLNNNTIFNKGYFKLIKLNITNSPVFYFEKEKLETPVFHKLSRGPPIFIV